MGEIPWGDTRTCASKYQVLRHRSRARVGGAEAAAVVKARRQVRLHRQDAALALGDVLGKLIACSRRGLVEKSRRDLRQSTS